MGTLQVGGTTLGVKNTVTNKVDLSNASIGSDTVFPAGGTGNPISVAVIVDEKANNTEGGNFTSGDWRTRDLNKVISDPDSIVTIESDTQTVSGHTSRYKFTLGAGTYLISWSAPAFVVTGHQSKLYSVTDTSDLAIGSSEYSNSTNGTSTISTGHYVHTISSSHTYEIRHRCSVNRNTNGFGLGLSFGAVNIFTQVLIQKLK